MDICMFLEMLVGQTLCYGIKSPHIDLFDLGFSTTIGNKGSLFIHAICPLQIRWNEPACIDKFNADTTLEEFQAAICPLIGSKITGVSLNEKNNLFLDFIDGQITIETFDDDEESWRLFSMDQHSFHLVASSFRIDFSDIFDTYSNPAK